MSDLLKISVGVVGLETEVDNEIAKINNQIPIALNQVGSEMILDLQKHIQEDFYNEYSPVAYRRRYEKGLLKDDAFDLVKGMSSNRKTGSVSHFIEFNYLPKGEPQGTLKDSLNWSEDLEEYLKSQYKTGETPFFSNPRNGDDLIVWGQTAHDIGTKHIPARPFWNNFVEEQKNGAIMNTFSAYMTKHAMVLEGGEQDLQFDGNESMLEAGNVHLKMK